MKTKRTLILSNIILIILLLIPLNKIDLFNENYSTLSLTTRGYLYVFFFGIFSGVVLSYETYLINNNKKRSLFMFLSLFIGTIIPHHIPYNIQGNLHLLFAYVGFFGLVVITFINLTNKNTKEIYLLLIMLSVVIYFYCGMVNTLSEIIVMVFSLMFNLTTVYSIKKL